MVDVYGDNSITDYVRRLRHPVFLKGALIGDGIQEPKIYIKRTMTENGTSRFSMGWYCVCVYVQVLCVYTVNVYACKFTFYTMYVCMYVYVNQVQY